MRWIAAVTVFTFWVPACSGGGTTGGAGGSGSGGKGGTAGVGIPGTAGTTGGSSGSLGTAGSPGSSGAGGGAAGNTALGGAGGEAGRGGVGGVAGITSSGAGDNGGGGSIVAPPSCGMVTPCGGSLVGTWKVLGGCAAELYGNGQLTCPPDIFFDLVGLGYSGTVTFNSDMTYTATFVGYGGTNYTIPSSCLPTNLTCADVNPTCSGERTCTCPAFGAAATGIAGSGVYAISGHDLTFSQTPDSSSSGISYCVKDGLLHLETWSTVILSNGTRTMPITSDVVAQMQ